MALIDKLTAIADAIRNVTGEQDKLTLEQMPGEIERIGFGGGGGGGDDLAKILLDRTATEFDFDTAGVTTIGDYACAYWASLETIKIKNVTYIGIQGFRGCSGITELEAPNLENSGASIFLGCGQLTIARLPKLKILRQSTFEWCSNMHTLDLGSCEYIEVAAWRYCAALETLILRNETMVCGLHNSHFTSDTAIGKGTGYIYVPRALLSDDDETKDYRRATNWSAYTDRIRAIEDYPEICGEVSA